MMSQPGQVSPPTPPLEEHNDIPYAAGPDADPEHKFDLYIPKRGTGEGISQSDTPPPLICFIHGGAWRS